MTTEGSASRGTGSGAALPAAITLLIGAAMCVLAVVVADGSAIAGVAVGVVLTCASLGLGSLVLAWVTETSPAFSLVVALMTYTLQVVLLLVAYVVLSGSEAARDAVSGRWLGVTVIATTFAWLTLQLRALKRSRTPYLEPAGSVAAERSQDDAA